MAEYFIKTSNTMELSHLKRICNDFIEIKGVKSAELIPDKSEIRIVYEDSTDIKTIIKAYKNLCFIRDTEQIMIDSKGNIKENIENTEDFGDLAENGYVIMTIKNPFEKLGLKYYNIELFIPPRYEQLYQLLDSPIKEILNRFDLSNLKKDSQNKELIDNTYLTVFMGKEELIKLKVSSTYNLTLKVLEEIKSRCKYIDFNNDTLVVTSKGDVYLQQNPHDNSYRGLLENIKIFNPELVEGIKSEQHSRNMYYNISKNGGLVLGFLHNESSLDTNRKVLYVPRNILGNKLQQMILKSILKEYATIRKFFSLTIFVDGEELNIDSNKWDEGDADYVCLLVMEEIRNRLKRIREQEEAR